MRRALIEDLRKWGGQANRCPLILRGPRQVGKSYLVNEYGKEQFTNVVLVNFELEPQYKACFEDLDPKKIIQTISLISNQSIELGKTLLFLDEIQICPQAIQSLRYFKELLPELHVIAAGSLLDFALNTDEFSMPVGRVSFMYLHPLSFQEFLLAKEEDNLLSYLHSLPVNEEINIAVHNKLINLVKLYFLLGGMPAVVKEYLEQNDLQQVMQLQSFLLQAYRSDFGKYAKRNQHKYLEKLFERIPSLLGEQFKYSKIDPDMLSRDLRQALFLLIEAGIITPVYATNANGLPLSSEQIDNKFKLAFLDIGLAQRACGTDMPILLASDLLQINQGALAEQFVAQELLAYAANYEPAKIYFWQRDKKGSQAEVDYVINMHNKIIPIEVKAGKTGTLKSLKIFMQEKESKIGVRISQAPLSFEDNILSIPFYLIAELPRILQELGC